MRTLKVVALVNDGVVPAARFRILQNIPYLAELNVHVKKYMPFISPSSRLPGRFGKMRERYLFPVALAKSLLIAAGRIPGTVASYRADLTWIGRTYIPGFEGLVRMVKGPRVLDVDDAIWIGAAFGSHAAARFARQMDAVIAGNNYVANWYSQYCKNVYVVPDGIDTGKFRPSANRAESKSDDFVIGWTGTSANFHELYRIEPALVRFLRDCPRAKLHIISNEPPGFNRIPIAQLLYKRWSAATEATDLNGFDVGIMPLQDTPWTRGKNSNKMLCYMSAGLPVVVSPVGTNAEILQKGDIGLGANSNDDWYDCLNELYVSPESCLKLGNAGRQVIEEHFSINVICKELARIFRGVVN